jgi:hypothetical protein
MNGRYALGCGFKCKLVRLLSLGVGCHSEPQTTSGKCRQMMHTPNCSPRQSMQS